MAHWDYFQATTSYSVQGDTVGYTGVHMDTGNKSSKRMLTQAMAYVSWTRAKEDVHVFTDDIDRLRMLLATPQEKAIGLSPEERYEFTPGMYRQKPQAPEHRAEQAMGMGA
jgi:ATP-dependent exoDNAse (exonuclease V) alpha subunit